MPKLFSQLTVVIAFAWTGSASAGLIDFEDLDASSGIWVPQGYYGFSWLGGGHNNGETSWVNSANTPLCINNPVCNPGVANSGENYAWSDGGVFLELSAGLFNIESLYVSARGNPPSSATVTFEGLLDGDIIFTTAVAVDETSYTLANLNFNGIDTLRFDSDINYNLLVDDISFSHNVALPATIPLLGIALAALGFNRRHKLLS